MSALTLGFLVRIVSGLSKGNCVEMFPDGAGSEIFFCSTFTLFSSSLDTSAGLDFSANLSKA
jgi:hypothetical protein